MTGFDERARAFEGKHKHDDETAFKIHVRAARLFGLWAAAEMGKTGDAAAAYAEDVVEADFAEPGIADLLAKVQKDLQGRGKKADLHHLENAFAQALDTARAEMAG